MMSQLIEAGYSLDSTTNVWVRPDYSGIAYSDGDEVEERIAAVIAQATDLTVLSAELRRHCTDWPSLYHLNGSRANILRPFQDVLAGANVLELGAGCGSITRYLGECGANVLAVEGSPRRAAIARSRTRDLSNISVVADQIDTFHCKDGFDFVIMIGVLEYANLFTPGEDPLGTMLARAKALLKPTGRLIIAIENQLGLKYFAGVPEDHLGVPMYGIEGRYGKDQPETFGRATLTRLLQDQGFAGIEFLLPFPDYKLPVSILTEEGINAPDFDGSAFAWQSVIYDRQLAPYYHFSLETTWPVIFQNRLALDLANSFLIVASDQKKRIVKDGVLAYHYSTGRQAPYCKETLFTRGASENIEVNYKRFGAAADDNNQNRLVELVCPDRDTYRPGSLLSREFPEIVTRDGWTIGQVSQFMKRYLDIVKQIAREQGIQGDFLSPSLILPATFFDAVPQNIIIHKDGSFSLIDNEWEAHFPMELGYLLFRALLVSMNSVISFGRTDSKTMTRGDFFQSVLAAVGVQITIDNLRRYMDMEQNVQEQVSGPSKERLVWHRWAGLPLPEHTSKTVLADLNAVVAERNGLAAERDALAAELDGLVAETNALAAERDALAAERDALVNSYSWRYTEFLRAIVRHLIPIYSWRALAPLRFVIRLARHGLLPDDRRWFEQRLHRFFRNLPLSTAVRARLSNLYISLFGPPLLDFGAQRVFLDPFSTGGQPSLPTDSSSNQCADFLMPEHWEHHCKPYGIIVLPIIEWNFRFQRPQQIARRFALNGHPVVYVGLQFASRPATVKLEEGVDGLVLSGRKTTNVYRDMPTKRDILRMADDLLEYIAMKSPHLPWICVVQLPFWGPVAVELRGRLGCPIVYDCMDDHSGFSTNGPNMIAAEDRLIRDADLVVASSNLLLKRLQPSANRSILVRNAADYGHFASVPATTHTPLSELTIGYYGAIADWFDSDLVAEMARMRPSWQFILIGNTFSADTAPLTACPNITLCGEKPYDELPGLISAWDCCIIPFKRLPLTEATNPVKIYEMLAAGKPVVTASLPELKEISQEGHIALADTAESMVHAIEREVGQDSSARQEGRRRYASENTWESRQAALHTEINQLFPLVSIIVVTYNNLPINRLCLESVFNDTDYPNYEVIVVDNGSSDGTPAYLESLQNQLLRVILNNENLGFAAANNQGMEEAHGDFLCLLNNDTVVTGPWLTTLVRHLQTNPECGLVGPVTNAIGNEAQIQVGYRALPDMPAWADAYCRGRRGRLDDVSMLAFFCVVVPRPVFEKVGLLDTRFTIGMFEDDDYNRRVRQAGYQVKLARDAYIHHWQKASFKLFDNDTYLDIFRKNESKYKSKWASALLGHRDAQNFSGLVATSKASKGTIIFAPSVGWNIHLFQRPHHLARVFAQDGYTVVFDCSNSYDDVDFLKEIEPRLFLFRGEPTLLANLHRAVLWTFTYNYDYRDRLPQEIPVIYDWIDDLTVFPYDQTLLAQLHERAIREATVVASVARRLHESALTDRPDALYLPNAVEEGRFDNPPKPNPALEDKTFGSIVSDGKLIAGYYGALAEWFDYELLTETARIRQDWHFVLIGPDYDRSIERSRIKECRNITWLGPRDYQTLPGYLSLFNAAIIPFKINDITRATSPLKLFEFFAGRKPVVTTPMPECMAFPEVQIAATVEEFSAALDIAHKLGKDPEYLARLAALTEENTWRARTKAVLSVLQSKAAAVRVA